MKSIRIDSDWVLISGFFLICILFSGTPDLMDAIIYWLSDGYYK